MDTPGSLKQPSYESQKLSVEAQAFHEIANRRRSCRKFSAQPADPQIVERALDAAILAPNSSNLQLWEFYWVRDPNKKAKLVEACLSQQGARTAADLVVFVARPDLWRQRRKELLAYVDRVSADPASNPRLVKGLRDYYSKLIPLSYASDPLNLTGILRWVLFGSIGLFRPMMRGPSFRSDIREVVVKSTALAAENFMLALSAEGLASLPMEGFDAHRVRRVLGLPCGAAICMVVGLGHATAAGIFGERFRVPRDSVVKYL